MKRARKLFIGLIVLCELSCAKVQYVPLAPEIIYCPEPVKPDLPLLLENLYLEHVSNIEIMMKRDDIMRLYIKRLEDAIICYKTQQGEEK